MNEVMKEVKIRLERRGVSFLEDGRDWRMPGLLYVEDLVQCGESWVMVGRLAEVCRRRELKVNAGKTKMMVLNGEEGLECEAHVDGIRLEHVWEFEYFGCVLDESGIDGAV